MKQFRWFALLAAASLLLALASFSRDTTPPWTSVADHLIETPVASYPFNWGEGVQMMGLMKAARATHDARYLDYVEQWARINEAKDIQALLNIGPSAPNKSRRRILRPLESGSAILYLYQDRQKPEHLKLVHDVVDFIRTDAEA